MTLGMTSGCGNARDQFRRGKGLLLRNSKGAQCCSGTSFKIRAAAAWPSLGAAVDGGVADVTGRRNITARIIAMDSAPTEFGAVRRVDVAAPLYTVDFDCGSACKKDPL